MASRSYRARNFERGRISGTAEAAQAIRELGENVLRAAQTALSDGVDKIVLDAKNRCPVSLSPYVAPGELRNSIKKERKQNGNAYAISANAQGKNGYFYGQIVEFSPRVNKPFLYPAMMAGFQQVRAAIRSAIKQETQKARAKK